MGMPSEGVHNGPMLRDSLFHADVAIYGMGYAAFAAALKAAEEGRRVFLFHRSSDLLWESSRAFYSIAGEASGLQWKGWIESLAQRRLAREGLIDSAGSEIEASAQLRARRTHITPLFGAYPIAAEWEGNTLVQLQLATKGGTLTLKASHWIDASEEGSLFQLLPDASAFPQRSPSRLTYRAVLHGREYEAMGEIPLPPRRFIEKRPWKNEVAIGIESREPLSSLALTEAIIETKAILKAADEAVSVISSSPYSEYEATESLAEPFVYGNLVSASPSFSTRSIKTLGDRFRFGVEAVEQLRSLYAEGGERVRILPPAETVLCQIAVVGGGTGGLVAALTADREGAEVLLVEAGAAVGGIGGAGLINGYFHGQPGGFYEAIDAEAGRWSAALDPASAGELRWHPEAKRLAFEQFWNVRNRILTHTTVYAVKTECGKVTELLAAGANRLYRILPQAVIDGTGDGDIAALAGAKYDFGRPGDGVPLSYSLPCLRVMQSESKPIFKKNNFDAGWVDSTDPFDLTRARLTAASQYQISHYSDGEHLMQLSPVLGVRQSRQIHTVKRLKFRDLVLHTQADDHLGYVVSPLDTHSVDFTFECNETLYWLWVCKHFRGVLYAHLPYSTLIPEGTSNLWLACRALGVTPSVAYAVRMQRDIQRMGEVVAYAAVECLKKGIASSEVEPEVWQSRLAPEAINHPHVKAPDQWNNNPVAQLDAAKVSGYLWVLYANRSTYEAEVVERLNSANRNVSWLAATVLAMWGDPRAEARLLTAIREREVGSAAPAEARGAFSQQIDQPNWFVAIHLLRLCGSAAALDLLNKVVAQEAPCFDLYTAVGYTLEQLAAPICAAGEQEKAAQLLNVLAGLDPKRAFLRPSRSICRELLGLPQSSLPQEPAGVDTREDHYWQLALVISRASAKLGVPCPLDLTPYRHDERALVRRAFAACLGEVD